VGTGRTGSQVSPRRRPRGATHSAHGGRLLGNTTGGSESEAEQISIPVIVPGDNRPSREFTRSIWWIVASWLDRKIRAVGIPFILTRLKRSEETNGIL
jgi:hypothetical protein